MKKILAVQAALAFAGPALAYDDSSNFVPRSSLPLSVANGGTGSAAAEQGNGVFVGPNPIAGASAEYPLTEGTGTAIGDIPGNGRNGTFCATGSTPTWNSYGLSFTAYGECVSTPVATFKTAIIHTCSNTTVASGAFSTLVGTPSSASGIDLSTFPVNGSVLAGVGAIRPMIWLSGCTRLPDSAGYTQTH